VKKPQKLIAEIRKHPGLAQILNFAIKIYAAFYLVQKVLLAGTFPKCHKLELFCVFKSSPKWKTNRFAASTLSD